MPTASLYLFMKAGLVRRARYDRPVWFRFWAMVDRDGPMHPVLGTNCWLWTGCKTEKGYGHLAVDGRLVSAHRLAWEIQNGQPIPAGMHVLHHCDNPACQRAIHLFVGTRLDNAADCVAKGRNYVARGERNGRAKLTQDAVREIRHRYVKGKGVCSQASLAREFGVHPRTIARILDKEDWGHVD
jgi:hypothetical protein